jgi:hypothetical protein
MNDFFSQLYELFGSNYIEGFSDSLYDGGVYTSTSIAMLTVAFLGMVLLYYVYFNWLRTTNSKTAWLIWLVIVALINGIVAYSLSYSALFGIFAGQNQDLPYGFGLFAGFSIINFVWSLVFSFVFSILIKGGSPHGKATPFLWPTSKTKSKQDIQ